jgi:hypothetical protein
MKQMSAKDRLDRQKYIGVWRWESPLMVRMMSRFPSNVHGRGHPKENRLQLWIL